MGLLIGDNLFMELFAPADILFERIQRRGMENPPISRDDVSRWCELFQALTAEEKAMFDDHLVADLAAGSS
jgi:hypothetical protein